MNRLRLILTLVFSSFLLITSCSQGPAPKELPDGRKPATWEDFRARGDYRETRDIWFNYPRLAFATPSNTKVVISLGMQRGQMFVDNVVAMDFPVCTGKASHPTPKGSFTIIEKKEFHRSGSYGSVFNAEGNMHTVDATPSSKVPKGGEYVAAAMPLWMRIHGAVGLHVGLVYRDPSSHGCIRLPREACIVIYENTRLGTPVVVKN